MLKQQAEQKIQDLDQQKLELEKNNQSIQDNNQHVNREMDEARQQVHQFQAQIASLQSSEVATIKQLERLQIQHQQSVERIADLESKLQTNFVASRR